MGNSDESIASVEKSLDTLSQNYIRPERQNIFNREIQAALWLLELLSIGPSEILNDLEAFIASSDSYVIPEKKDEFIREVAITLLDLKRSLIDILSKQIVRLDEIDTPELRALREQRAEITGLIRRIQLLRPTSQRDFESGLMWLCERGVDRDLELIERLRVTPPYYDDGTRTLLELAFKKIHARVYNTGTTSSEETLGGYAVFCSEAERENVPSEVQIVEQHDGYCIVSAPEHSISELRKRFPVRVLAGASSTGPDSEIAGLISNNSTAVPGVGIMRDHIVRFVGPVREDWRRRLETVGAKIIQPIGGSALVVSASGDALNRIRRMEEVGQVEPYVPDLRIRPDLIKSLGQRATEETLAEAWEKAAASASPASKTLALAGVFVASFFTKEDCDEAERQLTEDGIEILDRPSETRLVLNLAATTDAFGDLAKIASSTGLRSLEEEIIETPSNDVARELIGSEVVLSNPVPKGLSLTGKGEIVAIADTGLDTGLPSRIHVDFMNRVRIVKSYPIRRSLNRLVTNPGDDDGPADRYTGHGTHVAGSALGNGDSAAQMGLPRIQGIAPECELIFQAVEQTPRWNLQGQLQFLNQNAQPPAHGLFGLPDSLVELFGFAYDNGARIHSNSWGGGNSGEYNRKCEDVDQFVWEHKDFLVVVAAGNEGRQQGLSIGLSSVEPPGTAKNCITVGATANDRTGQFPDTYGHRWPERFPADPFKSENMVRDVDDLAAFSSRGPCTTTRRKPDVVAPGTFVLSTRSSQIPANNFAWGAFAPAKRHYMFMCGTSMATPLVAGSAALLRQRLRQHLSIAAPSAALLKAAIIHSAQYHNYRHRHPSSSQCADWEQGWGRVDLKEVLCPKTPKEVLFIDEQNGMSTGDERRYKVEITSDSVQFKTTLVYTDSPGEQLVNNLYLFAQDPNGRYYVGNDFAGSGNPDDVNNVEGIVVQAPALGEWTIRVVAFEVQQGPQDFALVLSGGGLARK